MSILLILDFLNMVESKVKSYNPYPDEEYHGRAGIVKMWFECEFNQTVDIRRAFSDFKKLVLHIGIEAGETNFHPSLVCIPESARDLMKDLYKNGMEIIDEIVKEKEESLKRARAWTVNV